MSVVSFGAGCFWGVEDTFSKINGVLNTSVGYQGGHAPNPTYEEVCNNTTGHAEVVRVEFDDNIVSFGELLNAFWNCHNPTTENRQGNDIGSQYRSVIFVHDNTSKEIANLSKSSMEKSGRFKDPIVTEIVTNSDFNEAEEYHQKYFEKNGVGACSI